FLNDQVTLFHAIISEDNQWHSFHKVIPANSLKQSSSNKLKFALDGNGVVDFSDVVILCQSAEHAQQYLHPCPCLHPLKDRQLAGEGTVDDPELISWVEFWRGRGEVDQAVFLTRPNAGDYGIGHYGRPLAVEQDAGNPR